MRDIERLFERAIEAIGMLTQQVSRLAYAAETQGRSDFSGYKTCKACQSNIQEKSFKECKACREHMGDG